jgi:hypothetical protein
VSILPYTFSEHAKPQANKVFQRRRTASLAHDACERKKHRSASPRGGEKQTKSKTMCVSIRRRLP